MAGGGGKGGLRFGGEVGVCVWGVWVCVCGGVCGRVGGLEGDSGLVGRLVCVCGGFGCVCGGLGGVRIELCY